MATLSSVSSHAYETLNKNKQSIRDIDLSTENFIKQHESYKQNMSDNQHNYETEMDKLEKSFNTQTVKTLNQTFFNYKVLRLFSIIICMIR